MTPYTYLSIRQPWSELIVSGLKRVENREWKSPPQHTGPLFVHAGRTMTKRALEEAIEFTRAQGFELDEAEIRAAAKKHRGGIVGVVNVTGSTRHPGSFDGYGMAKGFALAGCIGIQLADARPLPLISMKGFLGIQPLPSSYLGQEHRRAFSELVTLHRNRLARRDEVVRVFSEIRKSASKVTGRDCVEHSRHFGLSPRELCRELEAFQVVEHGTSEAAK